MEDDFSFSYKIFGSGWARATVGNGTQTVQMEASYLTDAFGDMVESIVDMIDGASRVWWDWQDEPGEHRWCIARYMQKDEEETIRLEIVSDAAVCTWRGLSPSERQARFADSTNVTVESDGTVVEKLIEGPALAMLSVLTWKTFLRVVLATADDLLVSSGGVEGYTKAWLSDEMPYPLAGVERIRQEVARLGQEKA